MTEVSVVFFSVGTRSNSVWPFLALKRLT
jgi:hypothetical protein